MLNLPVGMVELHADHFTPDSKDDQWMPQVGIRGWILIGHDGNHHARPAELSAIRQYQMGCFYLWGRHARTWQKMLCFLRSYEAILEAIETTPRPFIYRIAKDGRLTSIPLPSS